MTTHQGRPVDVTDNIPKTPFPERTDWTINPETGRSNSSERFKELVQEVARLLGSGAIGYALDRRWIESEAQLIMAQLAHLHHLAPTPAAVAKGDVIRIIPEAGPERVMLVSHVEHHIITLADLDGTTTA